MTKRQQPAGLGACLAPLAPLDLAALEALGAWLVAPPPLVQAALEVLLQQRKVGLLHYSNGMLHSTMQWSTSPGEIMGPCSTGTVAVVHNLECAAG